MLIAQLVIKPRFVGLCQSRSLIFRRNIMSTTLPATTSFATSSSPSSPSCSFSSSPRSSASKKAQPPVLCVVFDLESTGLAVNEEEVIQLGAEVLMFENGGFSRPTNNSLLTDMMSSLSLSSTSSSRVLPPPQFSRFVLPVNKVVTQRIQELTNITPAMLRTDGILFQEAISQWAEWITSHRAYWGSAEVALVGHNVVKYDVPLLFHQMARHKLNFTSFAADAGVTHVFDSLLLAKQWRKGGGNATSLNRIEAKTQETKSPLSALASAASLSSPSTQPKASTNASGWSTEIDFSAYKQTGTDNPATPSRNSASTTATTAAASTPVSSRKIPSNALGSLYKELLNRELDQAHNAMGDVIGVVDLLLESPLFLEAVGKSRKPGPHGSFASLASCGGDFCVPLTTCLSGLTPNPSTSTTTTNPPTSSPRSSTTAATTTTTTKTTTAAKKKVTPSKSK